MIDTIHLLIERYGLIAVFLGCVAEGESIAILAGFFTHQSVFDAWQAFAATFAGAFVGDTLTFLAGRRFAKHERVRQLMRKPGLDRALALVERRPAAYVLLNRYVYGFRVAGGIAAGLSAIPVTRFLALNAISSAIWAALFLGIGYAFGTGAEQVIGAELSNHQRIVAGFAVGICVAIIGILVARRFSRGGKRR